MEKAKANNYFFLFVIVDEFEMRMFSLFLLSLFGFCTKRLAVDDQSDAKKIYTKIDYKRNGCKEMTTKNDNSSRENDIMADGVNYSSS